MERAKGKDSAGSAPNSFLPPGTSARLGPGIRTTTIVVADVRAEKAALRFGTEEGLIIGSGKIEVAINIARVAESKAEETVDNAG